MLHSELFLDDLHELVGSLGMSYLAEDVLLEVVHAVGHGGSAAVQFLPENGAVGAHVGYFLTTAHEWCCHLTVDDVDVLADVHEHVAHDGDAGPFCELHGGGGAHQLFDLGAEEADV